MLLVIGMIRYVHFMMTLPCIMRISAKMASSLPIRIVLAGITSMQATEQERGM